MSTAVSYTTVIVSKQLPQEHTDIKDRVTELAEEVNVIKAYITKSREQVLEEATQVVEKKIKNLTSRWGHDAQQRERRGYLPATATPARWKTTREVAPNRCRVGEEQSTGHWPSLRVLGYGDKAISDYFTLSSTEQYPDQRVQRKRKIDQVVLLSDTQVKH